MALLQHFKFDNKKKYKYEKLITVIRKIAMLKSIEKKVNAKQQAVISILHLT